MVENPKDIDFVMFIDYQVYEIHESDLEKYWSFYLEKEGLDAYLAKVYSENHPFYGEYIEKCQEWRKDFIPMQTAILRYFHSQKVFYK